MTILVLGGTGAMGVPLVERLSKENKVFVTTRSKKESKGNVEYLQGDAMNDEVLRSLLDKNYDVIIDFMVYNTKDFRKRLPDLLRTYKTVFFL